jgi:hypothetical protein
MRRGGEIRALLQHHIQLSLGSSGQVSEKGDRYTMLPAVCWDGECEDAKRVELEAIREFRNNGIIENYDKYKEAELSFQGLCHRTKTESCRSFRRAEDG